MIQFNLQVFAEEESAAQAAEIPAELEGLSPEIAQEIMAEAEAEAPEEERQEASAKPDGAQEAENEASEAQKAETEGDKDAEAKPEDEKKPQHIPYERFKQVNEEKKARDEENARLRAQLEAIQKQQQEKLAPAVPPAILSAMQPQENAEGRRKLAAAIAAQARQNAMQLHGLTEADMQALEYEQPEKKQTFEASYQLELVKTERQLEDYAQHCEQAHREQQALRSQADAEYKALVKKFEADEDFAPVFEFASNEYFAALSPLEQRVLHESFARTEQQRASLQDVLLVRNHFLKAQQEYRAKQQAAQKETAQQSAEDKVKEKVNKAKAHPRTDQLVGGDNDPDGIPLAEIERMLNDPHVTMDQIPAEYRKLLLR